MADHDRASLSIFSTLWAVGALFHLAKWSLWVETPASLALAVAATLVLATPGALLPLTGLFAAQVWVVGREMPHTSNHLLLSGIVGTLGLLAIGACYLRTRGAPDPGAVYRAFAPPARLILLIVFFVAGFDKLNADWFHPQVSCGAAFYKVVSTRVPFLPAGRWAESSTIIGAIAIELAVPFLLLSRRSRLVGILLALVFLYAVGISGFFNFAAITAALLALFAPSNTGDLLRAGCERIAFCARLRSLARSSPVRRARWLVLLVVSGVAIVVALSRPWAGYVAQPLLVRELSSGRRPAISYPFEAGWWVYGLGLAAALLFAIRSGSPRWPTARSLLAHPVPALAIVPVLALLNGVSPYLGLKTETSFAMFSNLRTETTSNHLLVRRSIDVLGLQSDLVTIESSTDDQLQQIAERGYLLPLSELQAYVRARTQASGPDFAVTYARKGRRRSVERAGRDPELSRQGPVLARKLAVFRPVSAEGPNPCRH